MPNIKILIIDDEEDYCLILKRYFIKKNYDVFLAYSLKEGLRSLIQYPVDILFLDNNLPDGNGWQVADKLLQEYPDLHIYLISAYKHRSDFQTVPLRITVWEKPISFELLEKISENAAARVQQKESM